MFLARVARLNAQTHNLHNQIAAAQHALANQIRLLFLGTLAAMTAAATVVVTYGNLG